jgi:hypothetical protein
MKRITLARLPLIAGGSGYVSHSALALGMKADAIRSWLHVCSIVESFCMDDHLLDYWPQAVLYADWREAVWDQLRPGPMAAQAEPIRGWSIFGAMHNVCLPEWNGQDRSIVHLNVLGDWCPITTILLHEAGHHHLYQKDRLPFDQHCLPRFDKQVDKLAAGWLFEIADRVKPHDLQQNIRALNLLVQNERTANGSQGVR